MDDKKDYGKKEDLPLEIPDNSPAGGEKTIQARKRGTGKIKIAYAFALILLLFSFSSSNCLAKPSSR